MDKSTFFMAAGGTGGHILPALRIARKLTELCGAQIQFMGGTKGMESEIVPKWGFEIMTQPIMPMPRKLGTEIFTFPFNLSKAVFRAKDEMKKQEPKAVISTGGFASGPYSIAAGLLGIPLFLQEQNSYPGITQKWASLWAEKIYYAFPGSEKKFLRSKNCILTGNPIDKVENTVPRDEMLKSLGLSENNRTIFITGGSQGSLSINNAVSEFAHKLPKVNIIWQTGKKHFDALNKRFEGKENLSIQHFIGDMASTYMASDLIIARAGALTLSETSAYGKPSILIPYPFAAADHQMKNAHVFAKAGAAVVLADSELNMLEVTINEIISDIARLKQMSLKARELGRPEALNKICEDIIETLS